MTPMIVLCCFAFGAVVVGLAAHSLRVRLQRTRMKEPRGDWWPRFESEFRAYAERWEASTRHRRSASP